jgi:hypothetical protein
MTKNGAQTEVSRATSCNYCAPGIRLVMDDELVLVKVGKA